MGLFGGSGFDYGSSYPISHSYSVQAADSGGSMPSDSGGSMPSDSGGSMPSDSGGSMPSDDSGGSMPGH